jgi:SNF2 family DNA or RNA helicase
MINVELLAWMVARGALEMRVAFRVHAKTGHALAFDSLEDGYVHEKWAVFTDVKGDRISISGSLNESRQALVHNAENINLHADWWGPSDKQRINEAESSFQQLWENENPHIRVLTLPEAVREKLIRIAGGIKRPCEIDGSSVLPAEIEPPSAMERLRFAVIRHGPQLPGGRYVGMETAPVKPWPHQEIVARRLIRTWPYSYLLCDEVGLGKTIEAGLAIRSLYLSGLVKRVLVTPPASLTLQWQREMATKFFLPFARVKGGAVLRHEYLYPTKTTLPASRMYDPDLCIVSTGLMSRAQRLVEFDSARFFDIALVDEAHYARRKNPNEGERSAPRYGQLYKTIRDKLIPLSKSLWLATATPMQLNWIEVFDLIALTRRIAHFQKDPALTWAYYKALGKLVHDQDPDAHDWELLRRGIRAVKTYDPLLWQFFEEAVIDGRIRSPAVQWLEHLRTPRGIDRKNILRLIFAAAPLSRVMLRHTRPLLEIYRENGRLGANLARRQILPVPRIVLSGLEKDAYDALEDYCRELTRQIETNAPESGWKTSLGFYLSFLRLRFASSTFAIRETLKRRKERVVRTLRHLQPGSDIQEDVEAYDSVFGENEDIDEQVLGTLLKNRTQQDLEWEQGRLARMLDQMADLSSTPLKLKELLSVLEKRRRGDRSRIYQTVVFTRFYDTLTDIVSRLRKIDPAMRVGTYSGRGGQYVDVVNNRLSNANRDDIRHRFLRDEIDVLVCTDAAAEGLNLQTADLVINYDLPWNPMKVEQRIGRIDRIGQANERIYVLNLCYVNSAEQIVYDRLLSRLALAGSVVGAQQISMLPVTEEEFGELAAGTLNEETLLRRARKRISKQQQRTESIEIPARDLYEIYLRIKERQDREPPPVTLGSIEDAITGSKYLKDLGAVESVGYPALKISGIQHADQGILITTDREFYEKGAPDVKDPISFASYGDPLFESILEKFAGFDLPGCVVRIQEPVPDTHASVTAFAVCCINKHGQPETRLITRYSDLEGIRLDEGRQPDEAELDRARQKLHQLMRDEFDPTRRIAELIEENQRAGMAHDVLNLLVADSVFPDINHTDQDNFWQAAKAMDALIAGRDQLLIPEMPSSPIANIQQHLLFDIQVPRVGDKTSPTLPISLVASAVDKACREADSLREKKSDLTISRVKTRIKKELQIYLQKIDI